MNFLGKSLQFKVKCPLSVGVLVQRLNVKTYGAEAVVARNHCRLPVLHPTAVYAFSAAREREHERRHALPGAFTQSLGASPAVGNECVALSYVAGVFDGVFVFFHEVVVARCAYGRNFALLHRRLLIGGTIIIARGSRDVNALRNFIC